MDESRKQFEEWFSEEYEEVNNGTELSAKVIKMIAWQSWVKSRAAIEIELPNPSSMLNRLNFNSTYHSVNAIKAEDVEHAIRAAGIKVKE